MEYTEMLEQYDRDRGLYDDLAASMSSLIGVLIASSGVSPHSISSRVKERTSIARKIEKKDKYDSLNQITDIVGIRIITHYSDEVDKIAEIIETEFNVDIENSVDKRSILDPDRFGYLSLHYVVSIKPERSKLLEYKRFADFKFEIQIRSILQHTWAEIEHDIGYKAKVEVPKPIRRKFSRLAGLLELADDQFVQIRDDLIGYENAIRRNIGKDPENIGIDAVTIFEYVNRSQKLKELDEKVAQLASLDLKPLDKGDAGRHVKYLEYFGIESISELEQELIENEDFILCRASDIGSGDRKRKTASQGISIFYLHQVLAAKRFNKEELMTFLNEMNLSGVGEREEFANYLSNFLGSDA
ncbi:hypothetical protein LG325_05055 [Marinobacter nauticus]